MTDTTNTNMTTIPEKPAQTGNIILNTKTADSSSKIIFDNNILCSQFLRDYIDLPCLKNVQPEDIEDVSEQYVSLFAEERNADRVKKVHIKNENPFFLVSLIEHKSSIDYNVSMQIFRYMVYIWEAYAKEAEKLQKGITKRADFKYPPILPIVYYEGVANWTIPPDFKSRIIQGEAFGKYLPDFEYYLVPLRKYTNEELLAKKDEISLVMIINRMQNPEDIDTFRNLPADKVENILKNTPEHLLTLISDILRAFLLKMNVPVIQTEELVGKVKEKKMGYLFENVVPYDIEKEKQKLEQKLEKKLDEQRKLTEEQRKHTEEQQKRAEKAEQQVEKSIQAFIKTCWELGASKENTLQKVQENFELSEKEALDKISLFWKD